MMTVLQFNLIYFYKIHRNITGEDLNSNSDEVDGVDNNESSTLKDLNCGCRVKIGRRLLFVFQRMRRLFDCGNVVR